MVAIIQPMSKSSFRLSIIACLLLVGGAAWFFTSGDSNVDVSNPEPSNSSRPSASIKKKGPPSRVAVTPSTNPSASMSDVSAFAQAWGMLDLSEVRRAMPDNLVWKYAAPTKDPAVLEERRRLNQSWEKLYAKVYSNTASEKEVNDYYAHQQQRSADYIEFTTHIIDRHEADLREQDLQLLHLARRMHTARLQEIPRRQADALARRAAHAQARQDWREKQERFSSDGIDENLNDEKDGDD